MAFSLPRKIRSIHTIQKFFKFQHLFTTIVRVVIPSDKCLKTKFLKAMNSTELEAKTSVKMNSLHWAFDKGLCKILHVALLI
ncbi:unnamed protein product [Musa acuminata subsp. burmannicoides]